MNVRELTNFLTAFPALRGVEVSWYSRDGVIARPSRLSSEPAALGPASGSLHPHHLVNTQGFLCTFLQLARSEHTLCASHCAKHFTGIISLNPLIAL